MNRMSLLTWTSLALAAGGMIAAWLAAAAARAASEERAELVRHQRQTERQIRKHEEKWKVHNRPLVATAREPVREPVSGPARAPALAASPDLSAPAQQVQAVQRFKAALPIDYFVLYRSTGWTAERIAKFEAALAEHEGRRRDLSAVMQDRGLNSADPSVVALREEEEARFGAELRAAIGEEGERQFNQFRAEATVRRVVAQAVGALILTPTPLEPAQVQRLAEVLRGAGFARENRQRPLAEIALARLAIASPSGSREAWNQVLTEARRFLAPAQFAELEALAQTSYSDGGKSYELQRLIEESRKVGQPPGRR